MDELPIRIGVVGCGGFGLFALQQFAQVPGVQLTAMAGTHRAAALAAARRFGVPDVEDVESLVRRSDVDLVYIATPPFLHHRQALLALAADKHVICEKPLALDTDQADEMIAVARRRDRLLIANLMQRYNPLFDAVGGLVESGVLGAPLHGTFENYAADEGLPADHWFWDRQKSGGIFVEHGVHFFDLFAGWLGPGRVLAAQRVLRPGRAIEEQVHCTVRYGANVLVNFYHGFHQPGRMDRQQLRLLFERGDVTLSGWVPTHARVHALADEAQTRRLCQLLPGARLDVTAVYPPPERTCWGRHQRLDAYQMIELSAGDDAVKMHRYGELLRALLADQLAWVRDRDHRRRITDENGRQSLAMAQQADRLARADATAEPGYPEQHQTGGHGDPEHSPKCPPEI
jgi:predicted dehydrogenase